MHVTLLLIDILLNFLNQIFVIKLELEAVNLNFAKLLEIWVVSFAGAGRRKISSRAHESRGTQSLIFFEVLQISFEY